VTFDKFFKIRKIHKKIRWAIMGLCLNIYNDVLKNS